MKMQRFEGCWTAMVTPFDEKGELDLEGLGRNTRFQISQGAKLVPTGTTGESPTLDWKEHDTVIEEVLKLAKGETFVMAGTGSNSTKEALRATKHAHEFVAVDQQDGVSSKFVGMFRSPQSLLCGSLPRSFPTFSLPPISFPAVREPRWRWRIWPFSTES